MILSDVLGYVAGILVTVSFLPQTMKSWKTKQTRDISLGRYSLYTLGLVLWTIYGIVIMNLPLIVMSALDTLLAGSILFMKLRYG